MALQIDPRYPVLWRTPSSVQIGVDQPIVTLVDVTVADEYLLAVLRRGISHSGLEMIGESVGASTDQVADLLARVRPALRRGAASTLRLGGRRIAVSGSSAAADSIRSVLVALGARLVSGDDPESAELAILVSTFHTDPAKSGSWLRRDIPHLAVVFGDSTVRVGPLVEPGSGPCLHCIDRVRIDQDPFWPALVGQLLGRGAHTEDHLTASTVIPIVARAVLDRLADDAPVCRRHRLRSGAILIDGTTGDSSEVSFRPHPECACREVPPAEIGRVLAAGIDPSPTRNTTARDVTARA